MGDTCEDCRKWEEDFYWTHFQSMHFAQFLAQGFDRQLIIPKKFADNLKDRLPETVAFKGPSGITWNVELTTSGDTLIFKNGWKEFVKENCLEENDFLIFRYNRNSHFDVLIFDRQSLCEKEATYFVRRCEHAKFEGGCRPKGDAKENSVEVVCNSLHDDDQCTSSKKSQKMDHGTPVSSAQRSICRTRQRMTRKKVENYNSGGQISINKTPSNYVQYISNRRPVTEEEKDKTLQKALATSNKEGFLVIMRPTHVYKRFFVVVPTEWVTSHLSWQSQDVILRHKENIWHAKYYARGRNAGLTGGWKHFAVENNLEEFDVCVFELGDQLHNTVVLDVGIFRVVEEMVPLISS
ncbi:B3 domain-containing protein REM16-like [Malania oleifera]|uniref:B3 domain-containing protein REM16-like n=1 Tax=Malania oleifera TaxID=397392 RepID=UPI0025ADC855|nr:B3 domain-containing protein REM16-like [Malania oleifera]XP_057974033.1 B3 domain-containing protein REM16-like [Malania oleifera]